MILACRRDLGDGRWLTAWLCPVLFRFCAEIGWRPAASNTAGGDPSQNYS